MTPAAKFSKFGELLYILRPRECKKMALQKPQNASQEDGATLSASP